MGGESYRALEADILAAMAREEWAEGKFESLAQRVYHFQRANNPHYARFCEELQDSSEIPGVPQGAFKRYALRSFPESETCATFLTSGTTGEIRGAHHFRSLDLYRASVVRGFCHAGLPRLPQFILVPRSEKSSLSRMMEFLGEAATSQEWFADAERGMDFSRLERAIAEASGPVMLLGTALAFVAWFERGNRVVLPPGSIVFETGGYKGVRRKVPRSELYARLSEFLGLPVGNIVNEYGMTELSSQFYSRGLGAPHRGAPWIRARVVDPETGNSVADGEAGILQFFDLANLGSVMAIETRDLGVRRGADFELLGRDPGAMPRGCSRSADELLAR